MAMPAGDYNIGYCVRNGSGALIAGLGLTAGVAVVTP